ncbi:methionine aminopeptidase [Cytobacillus sp. Sa5YUA1]|uniref:Methionine aminopeptidase n=1 Tax=Cytobacillus stercorigallinarum TaxID=2762240 RepID=A0ABR8QQP3_9BACI|nr:methionine aminopeptidase [Cytobacillus stercorigallinarum]MBD7937861.1 methionine aminopeptidase [Cytobacillus stercorigallinarum]
MSLGKSFNQWKNAREHKHLEKMKRSNRCPECYGQGFLLYPSLMYSLHSDTLFCPGCEGSGRFNDWERIQEKEKRRENHKSNKQTSSQEPSEY